MYGLDAGKNIGSNGTVAKEFFRANIFLYIQSRFPLKKDCYLVFASVKGESSMYAPTKQPPDTIGTSGIRNFILISVRLPARPDASSVSKQKLFNFHLV